MANGGIAQVDLVGPSRGPVVTPQATQQLSEAFRSGFITADDIVQRMSERTRAKQELELVTAKQGLEIAPLVQQAKTAELKAAIFDAQAKPGGFDQMQNALSKAGFPVNIDPNAGLTDANKNEIVNRFSALQQYVTKRAEAEDRLKSTETKFLPTEEKRADGSVTKGQLPALFKGAEQITSDQFKSWTQEAEALRRTPFSQWYALQTTKPGQVAAAPAPVAPAATIVISPVEAAQQRAQLANAGVPNAASLTDQQVASLIQPRVTAPAAVASAPTQIGQTTPGLGIVTSIEAAGPPKPPTEVAGRSGSFAGRMAAAENQLTAVITSGFDPTTASVAAQQIGLFPEGFKQDDVKRFENAKLQWVTALLRRESGAAVPKWELDLYDRAFFPQWGDSADIIKQKAQVRQQTAQSLLQESEGKPTFISPAPVVTPGAAATIPTGATENTAVVNGKTYTVRIDPSTGQKRYFVR